MSEKWQYQLRLDLSDVVADAARRGTDDPAIGALRDVLKRHNATLKCQYDAFAGYVAEAEQNGVEKYPLYAWTRATIEDPAKQAKYLKSFTLYVDGEEVYDRELAEPLEAELRPLVDGETILRLAKHDTNPANNPQPPKRDRQ